MLRVIAVFDGRPGHEKQTNGILKGLQEHVAIKIIRVEISGYSLLHKILLWCQVIMPFFVPRHKELMGADLIIGTGSKTHSTILKLKRRYGLPACTCMTPHFLYRRFFDFCFVPEHDKTPQYKNIVYTLGAPNCNKNKQCHQSSEGLILLGGIDTSSHFWENDVLIERIEKVVSREPQLNWTITSSPRTPLETVKSINNLVSTHINVRFFSYEETPRGWVENQYDKCEVVWVTSDSISMLYEALTAGCRVHIFPMHWKKSTSKFKRNEDILIKSGKVQTFENWLEMKTLDRFSDGLNEAQRCADTIIKTWWPKSLQ